MFYKRISCLNCIEEDDISEITCNEEDYIEQGFLYYKGEVIEKVDISLSYEEENFIYKFVRYSSKGLLKNLRGKVYEEDNNIIDVIVHLIIKHILYFSKDNIRLRGLLYNYIDSISNTFNMVDGTLKVKLHFGCWFKDLLDHHYKKGIFFWKIKKK